MIPSESSVRPQGLKRQPTEDLEDTGDEGDADDDDMNAIGAVCEEPVITIGVEGGKWDECENDEESYVDDVNGSFENPEMVRDARVEELVRYLKMQRPILMWFSQSDPERNNTEEESPNCFASTPPLGQSSF